MCTLEWGYGRLSTGVPKPEELPLEWSYAGARPRAIIEYGMVAENAPEQVHQLFCATALITGVSTWPASDGALELFKILKPPGDLERYQFEDWRNKVVTLDQRDCYSAVYSRVGEAYVVLANLAREAREVNCKVNPEALKNALSPLTAGEVVNQSRSTKLDPGRLTGVGEKIMLPAANAILLHLA